MNSQKKKQSKEMYKQLRNACIVGNVEKCKSILKIGLVDVNYRDDKKKTVIFI